MLLLELLLSAMNEVRKTPARWRLRRYGEVHGGWEDICLILDANTAGAVSLVAAWWAITDSRLNWFGLFRQISRPRWARLVGGE